MWNTDPKEYAVSPSGTSPRIFISYSHIDKKIAGDIKSALNEIQAPCFLAHEDIQVSEEWRAKILEELQGCNVFIPLLSKSFRESAWAPQEIGAISVREGVLVIPLSVDGTVPFGFINHIQSTPIRNATVLSDLLFPPLVGRFSRFLLPQLITALAESGTFRGAEARMKSLVPHFGTLTLHEANWLASTCIANTQIWLAKLCRSDYLPKFLSFWTSKIDSTLERALSYQIGGDECYPG